MFRLLLCIAFTLPAVATLHAQQESVPVVPPAWQRVFNAQLPLLGHRNWIVIADSAYPWQTAPGIDTVVTNGEQLDVLKTVLAGLGTAPHVKPTIYTDAELAHVPEQDAKGITAYRAALAPLLAGQSDALVLPHEQIIAKLDEAGKTFHVLLLKTKLAIPYTSVFIQLDCAYWNTDAEKRLREAMAKSP